MTKHAHRVYMCKGVYPVVEFKGVQPLAPSCCICMALPCPEMSLKFAS